MKSVLQEKIILLWFEEFLILKAMYYQENSYLSDQVGNNALSFQERKNHWSDTKLFLPKLIEWTLDDVCFARDTTTYEYVDEEGKLVSSYGLESLVKIDFQGKDLYIIDNHNHAFALWWRSYVEWIISRWSHLIHIDQHSDYAEPEAYMKSIFPQYEDLSNVSQEQIDIYTNEVLTIASFIKPALTSGLCGSYEMILTEYSLWHCVGEKVRQWQGIILDIDLDFRAPEMGIQAYDTTINQVRQLFSLPQVKCITIATSPTYIEQERALEILHDLMR